VLSANRNYPPGRIVGILDICRSVPLRIRFPGEAGFPAQCQGLKESVLRRTLLSRGVTVNRAVRMMDAKHLLADTRRIGAHLSSKKPMVSGTGEADSSPKSIPRCGQPVIDGRGDRCENVGRAHLVLEAVGIALREVLIVADAENDVHRLRSQRRKHIVCAGLHGAQNTAHGAGCVSEKVHVGFGRAGSLRNGYRDGFIESLAGIEGQDVSVGLDGDGRCSGRVRNGKYVAVEQSPKGIGTLSFFTALVEEQREREPIGMRGGYNFEAMDGLSEFRVVRLCAVD
jgi:hypothetical protein